MVSRRADLAARTTVSASYRSNDYTASDAINRMAETNAVTAAVEEIESRRERERERADDRDGAADLGGH